MLKKSHPRQGTGLARSLEASWSIFDALHEALTTRAADEESGTVLETTDRGYRLDGQVLRPARVVVSE